MAYQEYNWMHIMKRSNEFMNRVLRGALQGNPTAIDGVRAEYHPYSTRENPALVLTLEKSISMPVYTPGGYSKQANWNLPLEAGSRFIHLRHLPDKVFNAISYSALAVVQNDLQAVTELLDKDQSDASSYVITAAKQGHMPELIATFAGSLHEMDFDPNQPERSPFYWHLQDLEGKAVQQRGSQDELAPIIVSKPDTLQTLRGLLR